MTGRATGDDLMSAMTARLLILDEPLLGGERDGDTRDGYDAG